MAKSRKKAKLVRQLVIFMNPAPLASGEDGADATTRENTPWYVSIPSLGVSVQAQYPDGRPVTGYWEDSDAVAHAFGLWMLFTQDAELLAEARANPEWPEDMSEGNKTMQRTISVPAL